MDVLEKGCEFLVCFKRNNLRSLDYLIFLFVFYFIGNSKYFIEKNE